MGQRRRAERGDGLGLGLLVSTLVLVVVLVVVTVGQVSPSGRGTQMNDSLSLSLRVLAMSSGRTPRVTSGSPASAGSLQRAAPIEIAPREAFSAQTLPADLVVVRFPGQAHGTPRAAKK